MLPVPLESYRWVKTVAHQLRLAHLAEQEHGGLHWLCTNSLWEEAPHKQWLPGGLKGSRLWEGLLFPRTASLCLSQTTCTTEASCEKTALSTLWLAGQTRPNTSCRQCLREWTTLSCLEAWHMWTHTRETRLYWRTPFLSYLEAIPTMQLE